MLRRSASGARSRPADASDKYWSSKSSIGRAVLFLILFLFSFFFFFCVFFFFGFILF